MQITQSLFCLTFLLLLQDSVSEARREVAARRSPVLGFPRYCVKVPETRGEPAPMFDDVSLMPHAVCWGAAPRLVWTMVIANSITFLSYVSICITLFVIARRTRCGCVEGWDYFLVVLVQV